MTTAAYGVRSLNADQRYLIWKYCHEQGEAWRKEHQAIQTDANRKRSEATKKQHAVSNPRAGEKSGSATNCRTTRRHKSEAAKAEASKTNRGAVARGDKLAKDRPDLAEAVRQGKMRPRQAQEQMKS